MSDSSSIDQPKVKSKTIEVQTSFATVSGKYLTIITAFMVYLIDSSLPTFRSNLSLHILWYCLPSDSLINRIYGGCDHFDIFKSCLMSFAEVFNIRIIYR